MEKYSGEKNFKDFFMYLNTQQREHIYREIDSKTIQKFVDSFAPLKLPLQYINFMKYAGNGDFWIGSDCSFDDVAHLNEWANELLEENHFPHRLKEDDFVFWMHQGYKFCFFNLREGDDPPVYYYTEEEDLTDFVKRSDSFTGFIIDSYLK